MKCKKCSLPIFYQHQDPATAKKCAIKFILPGALSTTGDGKSAVYDQVKAKRQDRVGTGLEDKCGYVKELEGLGYVLIYIYSMYI